MLPDEGYAAIGNIANHEWAYIGVKEVNLVYKRHLVAALAALALALGALVAPHGPSTTTSAENPPPSIECDSGGGRDCHWE